MASTFVALAQHFLELGAPSLFRQSPVNSTSSCEATISDTSSSTAFPTDIAGILTLIFSFPALYEWLKLFLIGGILETLRRHAFAFYYHSVNSIFVTARFTQNDSSYTWIMMWLAKQPSWGNSRDVEISTVAYGGNSAAIELEGEDDTDDEYRGTKKITYVPSLHTTYRVWYKRRPITISRTQAQPSGIYDRPESTLTLCIFDPFRSSILKHLLAEARQGYIASQTKTVGIWVTDSGNNWRYVASREKRSLNSIILDPGVQEFIVEDAKDFLESEAWYRERGIPFRRGYLLHGAPGSGKTSLIHGIAGELGLNVFVIALSRIGLDDSGLSELVNNLPPRCIAVMEDIDAAFTHGLTRNSVAEQHEHESRVTEDSAANVGIPVPVQPPMGPSPPISSRISLSGLLNSLDGIASHEGRILFATTNKYTALDPALCRPGRMDLHIEFKNASKYQAQKLFERFYLPKEENIEQKAQNSGKDKITSTDSKDEENKACTAEQKIKDSDSDSGYSSISAATPSDTGKVEEDGITGHRHKMAGPKLAKSHLIELAQRFADAIPERECSMASLQGYLMMQKSSPILAVEEAPAWVEKERSQARMQKGMLASQPSLNVQPNTDSESVALSGDGPETVAGKPDGHVDPGSNDGALLRDEADPKTVME